MAEGSSIHMCGYCRQPLMFEACEKHPRERKTECPHCDLCSHGVGRSGHCDACHINDDQSWRTAPLSEREIERLWREISEHPNLQPSRGMPNPARYYRSDNHEPLWKVLLIDYLRLKSIIDKKSVCAICGTVYQSDDLDYCPKCVSELE